MEKKDIAMAAIFAAFVAVSTMSFTLYIPATRGYFNLGEAFVYISALLGGPIVGMIAGGVGSAMADVMLGYAVFAPGTLVIKGIEGLVAGYIFKRYAVATSTAPWRAFGLLLSATVSALLAYIGISYFSGEASLSIPSATLNLTIYHIVWIFIATLFFFFLTYNVVRVGAPTSAALLATTLGGICMVIGYFLYEAFALRLGIAVASVEVPFNAGQYLVGSLIAIPVIRAVRRMTGR